MYRKIYHDLNQEFFDNELTPPIFLMGRHDETIGGYFAPLAWSDSKDPAKQYGEICINAHLLRSLDIAKIIMVLFHEMLHQYQFEINPSQPGGVHDEQYVEMGEMFGLKTIIMSQDTTAASGEIIPGSRLDKFAQDWTERVTAEDFFKATPNKVIPIDPRRAAQPMPKDPKGGKPGQGEGQGQGEGGEAGGEAGEGGSGGGDGESGGMGSGVPLGGSGQEGGSGTPGGEQKGQGGAGRGQKRHGDGEWQGRDPKLDRTYICPLCGSRLYGKANQKFMCLNHAGAAQLMIEARS